MKTGVKFFTCVTFMTAISIGGIAHAEGFFSNLFGGSKSGTDLKSLLSNVPADTSYLMANKQLISEKVAKAHIQRGKDIFALFQNSDLMKKTSKDAEGAGKFFIALIEEYVDLLDKDKLEDSGLSMQSHYVLYGYEMMPVMRLGVTDKDKLMAMIKRVEEKSSYKVELTKCGKFDCFESTDPDGKFSVAIAFLDGQLAIAGFPADKKEGLTKHLIGEAKPKSSYSESNWDSFLKENNYPGYGDGFINLKSAFNFAKPMIVKNNVSGMDEKTLNGCLAVADQHFDNLSELVFGTKSFEKDSADYEVLFKTSETVSTMLQTLANDSNIAQRTENAIFDYGLNVNFTKLRDALTQYSSFLIKSGEDNKCSVIQAQEIRKSMGGMAMVMNMGLSQFNSIYASISDIQLDDRMQPKKVDAVISLGSNDPAGLISMASLMAPPLGALEIPADGSVTKLPEDLLPSRGAKAPDIFLSRTAKAINIFVGTDKPSLKSHSNEISEIGFSSMDAGGYIKLISNVIDAMPKGAPQSEAMPDIEMLKKIGEIGGKMRSTTSADKRGLAINYNIKY